MNLSEQVMGDEAAWELACHEIQLDRQHAAENTAAVIERAAQRIQTGMATVEDACEIMEAALWIRSEYGLNNRKETR